MSGNNDFTSRYRFDISELKKGITEANALIKSSKSEYKAAGDGSKEWAKSIDGLNAKLKSLGTVYNAEKTKLSNYQKQLELTRKAEEDSAKKVEELRIAYQNAKDEYGENSKEAKTYAKALYEAEKELSKNQQAASRLEVTLNNQKGTVNRVSSEMDKYENELKSASTATSQLSSTIQGQEEKLNGLKEKYKNLVLEQKDGTDEAKKLASEIKQLSKELNDNKSKLNDAEKATDQFDESMDDAGDSSEKLTSKLGTLEVAIGTALGQALINGARKVKDGFIQAASAGIEFESAFAGVKKTVDGTPEELAQLSDEIRKMATELPATASEISQVAELAGQLGIKTKDITSFTRTIIDLGESTNLTGEEAATMFAKFANITGLDPKHYNNLGSAVVELGNNYATTERDIMAMAMRLAGAGAQVGMSQSDILALSTALSSVGVEAEMGGSAFSKVMVQMQLASETGGQSLEDFARVAGMSADEFATKFKTDATGALLDFIKGLSAAGEQGQSAIKVLDDMGITEVRLRDALLRSANASDVFSEAIDTSNQAFKENTALQKEAEQRYATTESQIQIMKNTANDLAIEFSKYLMPAIKGVVGAFTKWAKSNDGKKAVKEIADVTGELLKVASKVIPFVINNFKTLTVTIAAATLGIKAHSAYTKIAAAETTGMSIAQQVLGTAYGLLTGKISLATVAQQGLNLVQSLSPVGLLTAGIGALIAATILLGESESEETKIANERLEKAKEEVESWNQVKEAKDEALSDASGTWGYYQRLKDELDGLVGANGEVEEANRKRAQVIIDKLNPALETELQMVDGAIQGYEDQGKALDELIAKKRAAAIIEAGDAAYVEATTNITKAIDDVNTAEENYNKEKKKRDDYRQKVADELGISVKEAEERMTSYYSEENQKRYDDTKKTYEERKSIVQGYTDTIAQQEYLQKLYAEGSAEDIAKINEYIAKSYDDKGKKVILSTEEQIKNEETLLTYLKDRKKETNSDIYDDQIAASEKQLSKLKEDLSAQTSTVAEGAIPYGEAWKNFGASGVNELLSNQTDFNSVGQQLVQDVASGVNVAEVYGLDAFSRVGDNMVATINGKDYLFDATGNYLGSTATMGIVNGMQTDGIYVLDETNRLKDGVLQTYKNGKWQNAGKDSVYEIAKGTEINGEETRKKMRILADGTIQQWKDKKWQDLGKSATDGVTLGIDLGNGAVSTSFGNVAFNAINAFKNIFQIKSPSRVMKKLMGFVIDGAVISVEKNKKSLIKSMADMASNAIDSFENNLQTDATEGFISNSISTLGKGANKLKNKMSEISSNIKIDASGLSRANKNLSTAAIQSGGSGVKEVKQDIRVTTNNYSPKALSIKEIYNNSRRQTQLVAALVKNGG